VETIDQRIERIAAAAAQLKPESLGTIDFDTLRALLQSEDELLADTKRDREELTALRRDLIGRIAGMAKAIAAVSRRRDLIREAAEYVERLEHRDAAGLIEEYRLVSARFRDSFPTSFGRLFERGPKRTAQPFDRP